jgi:RNA polymerase sigma factor (sigma-70 family)
MGETGRTDAELIRFSEDDPETFGVIFDRHFAAVYRFCARRVEGTRSEELTGEVFRRAFERRSLYDTAHDDARPWLFAIALNLVRDTLRSGASRHLAFERLCNLADVAETDPGEKVTSLLDARRDLAVIAEELRRLPPTEVDPLLLLVWDGLSYAEIAQVLGIPVGTVRSRLNRVRDRLRALVCEPDATDRRVDTARRNLR